MLQSLVLSTLLINNIPIDVDAFAIENESPNNPEYEEYYKDDGCCSLCHSGTVRVVLSG